MKNYLHIIALVSCLPLASCATTTPGQYQEPKINASTAYIVLKQDSALTSFGKTMAVMPTYTMAISGIDNKPFSDFWGKNKMAITPGPHTVTISCSVNAADAGQKQFTINAKPGQSYTISFSPLLSGYNFTVNACNLLTLT